MKQNQNQHTQDGSLQQSQLRQADLRKNWDSTRLFLGPTSATSVPCSTDEHFTLEPEKKRQNNKSMTHNICCCTRNYVVTTTPRQTLGETSVKVGVQVQYRAIGMHWSSRVRVDEIATLKKKTKHRLQIWQSNTNASRSAEQRLARTSRKDSWVLPSALFCPFHQSSLQVSFAEPCFSSITASAHWNTTDMKANLCLLRLLQHDAELMVDATPHSVFLPRLVEPVENLLKMMVACSALLSETVKSSKRNRKSFPLKKTEKQ